MYITLLRLGVATFGVIDIVSLSSATDISLDEFEWIDYVNESILFKFYPNLSCNDSPISMPSHSSHIDCLFS
jgi:hypothetical protein